MVRVKIDEIQTKCEPLKMQMRPQVKKPTMNVMPKATGLGATMTAGLGVIAQYWIQCQ
jgi:hypothetical protein